MFTTSLATAAVTGLLAVSAIAPQPNWQSDYAKARVLSAEQNKPVAVFIGRGDDGYTKLVAEGTLGADAAQLLKQKYVPVYVNTATDLGKAVAASFEMTQGIVISDKTGGVQALRHQGAVGQADLTKYLEVYADGQSVAATAYQGAVAPAAYSAPVAPGYRPYSSCPNGNCGGGMTPMFGGYNFGGGCPGGNCRR